MTKTVPFVANTDDNLHCLQATFMSMLLYFKPDYKIEWKEWERITGFEADMGSWPFAALVWFAEQGFLIKHIEPFDLQRFADEGEAYLRECFPGETATWQIEHTNIPAEQIRARRMAELGVSENRIPTMQDITALLDDDYLIRALINSRKLNNKPGYFGHIVTVIGYDEHGLTIHDPGLPAIPYRQVSYKDFSNAWVDPIDGTAEISAVKLA